MAGPSKMTQIADCHNKELAFEPLRPLRNSISLISRQCEVGNLRRWKSSQS